VYDYDYYTKTIVSELAMPENLVVYDNSKGIKDNNSHKALCFSRKMRGRMASSFNFLIKLFRNIFAKMVYLCKISIVNVKKCPKCTSIHLIKSGVVKERQRYKCKQCNYYFTVDKIGKNIDNYYVVKAIQLYVEGVSYREIERLLGVSHVSVMNWIKKYKIKRPDNNDYHPTYKILNHEELVSFIQQKKNISGAGIVITELGDKFMTIKWERFRD
jgi:transposase-like protein